MVEPHSSNFRVITTKVLGVWIFRKFKVVSHYCVVHYYTYLFTSLCFPCCFFQWSYKLPLYRSIVRQYIVSHYCVVHYYTCLFTSLNFPSCFFQWSYKPPLYMSTVRQYTVSHYCVVQYYTYEGCSGSLWNLVIKFSNIVIILSFFIPPAFMPRGI